MQRREVKHVAVSQITSFSTEFKRIQSFKELLAKQAPLKKKSDNRFYRFFDNYWNSVYWELLCLIIP